MPSKDPGKSRPKRQAAMPPRRPSERDDIVDMESKASFPASDPPSFTPVTKPGNPRPKSARGRPASKGAEEPEWLSSPEEDMVDQESADSFPASDPPSFTPVSKPGDPRPRRKH